MNDNMIQELLYGLNTIYGTVLLQVILYGSVARNTNTSESDIDIAVILDTINTKDYEEPLLDFIVDMNLKYDRVFSIIDIKVSDFIKWENTLPFFKNVKKDGVVLWKAA
ncbi:nucleotidyltransferase family protein [Anaerocolumna sp. MB42-C2]|uniref:nucleotidyltransferase family protein n=1 Tax=Anaerocolumna sp. MB42-C2 TaxID=3070997 RepID=UPI0027E1980E|nr:nucleotidyltransferase domain-containing protein [Anaerocolumna sp. MB42-C2]WMJ88539.1 nucleotidyltransferase domain-containing protein [Anaerocolumna sp. MB42-C2]